jgi:competence protein ComEA
MAGCSSLLMATMRRVRHSNSLVTNMRSFSIAIFLLGLITSCTSNQSPDTTRKDAADATVKIREESKKAGQEIRKGAQQAGVDAKAIAQGVREGWRSGDKVDLNAASQEQLMQLPGVDQESARRIIQGRPYHTTEELETRSVVSVDVYSRIKDQVVVR